MSEKIRVRDSPGDRRRPCRQAAEFLVRRRREGSRVRRPLKLDASVTRARHAWPGGVCCPARATIQMTRRSRGDWAQRQNYGNDWAKNQRSKNASYRKKPDEMSTTVMHFDVVAIVISQREIAQSNTEGLW